MKIVDSEKTVENPQIEQLFKSFQKNSGGKKYLSVHERKKKLKLLGKTIMDHRQYLRDALQRVSKKPAAKTDMSEIWPVLTEIRHARKHVDSWSRQKAAYTATKQN